MKTIKNKFLILIACFLILGCNEDSFLEEIPKDFLSPEIAYVTVNDFDAAVLNLYAQVRNEFYTSDNQNSFPAISWDGTDMVYAHKNFGTRPDWGGSLLLPTNTSLVYEAMWRPAYRIIYDVNVIIGRSEGPQSQLTAEQKKRVQAEAAFFRGFMYKMLANLYGDVPIVLEEVTSPRRDFVLQQRRSIPAKCS